MSLTERIASGCRQDRVSPRVGIKTAADVRRLGKRRRARRASRRTNDALVRRPGRHSRVARMTDQDMRSHAGRRCRRVESAGCRSSPQLWPKSKRYLATAERAPRSAAVIRAMGSAKLSAVSSNPETDDVLAVARARRARLLRARADEDIGRSRRSRRRLYGRCGMGVGQSAATSSHPIVAESTFVIDAPTEGFSRGRRLVDHGSHARRPAIPRLKIA